MNYIIFGRLLRTIQALDPYTEARKLSFLNPRKISAIFLGSDIISFLIQACGSSTASSDNATVSKIGIDIVLAGLSINFASFTLFISTVIYFDIATKKAYNATNIASPIRPFYPVVIALYFSWFCIMVDLMEMISG